VLFIVPIGGVTFFFILVALLLRRLICGPAPDVAQLRHEETIAAMVSGASALHDLTHRRKLERKGRRAIGASGGRYSSG
jgi:hypothetical protein